MSICPPSASSRGVSLSDVHWSVRRNKRSVCLSCQVSRLLVLPWGICRLGQLGLPLSRNSSRWAAFQLKDCLELVVSDTGLSEMLCGQQARNDRWSLGQSFLEWSLKTPYTRGRSGVSCKAGVLSSWRRKWDFETRRYWLLLFQLTQVSNFKLCCSWSSSEGSAGRRCPGLAPLEQGQP